MFEGKQYKVRDITFEIDVCGLEHDHVHIEMDYYDSNYSGEFLITLSLKNIDDSTIEKKTMDFEKQEYYYDDYWTYEEVKFITELIESIHKYYT